MYQELQEHKGHKARPFDGRTLGALNTVMQYEENQLRQRAGSPPPESRKSNKRARLS